MSKHVHNQVHNPLKIIKFVGNEEQSHVCPLPLELCSVKPTRAQWLWSHRHYSVSWGENNLSEAALIAPTIHSVQPPQCFSGRVCVIMSRKTAENNVYLSRRYLQELHISKGKTACLSSSLKEKVLKHEKEVGNKNFQDEWGRTGPREQITLTSKGGTWGSRNHMNGCTHL